MKTKNPLTDSRDTSDDVSQFKRNRSRTPHFLLLLMGGIAILIYLLTPDSSREIRLFPESEVFPLLESFAGGPAGEISWHSSVEEKPSQLRWMYRKGSSSAGYAGIKWRGHDVGDRSDLSFYDTILIQTEPAPETMTLLLTIRTFDPKYSSEAEPSTWKVNTKEFTMQAGQQNAFISLQELYVPDWWFQQNNADPKDNEKFLNRSLSVEISPDYSMPAGTESSLIITSIKAIGYSNQNFGILMIAILFLIILSVGLRSKPTTPPS